MSQLTPSAEGTPVPHLTELLCHALDCAANPVFLTDREGVIVWTNAAFCRVSGYSREELVGSFPGRMNSGMQSEAFYAQLWRTILAGKVWHGQITNRRKSGALYVVNQTITPVCDEDGVITHFLAIQQDMTLQTGKQEHEHYLAYHDILTGLPNRALFSELEQQALSYADRTRHRVALLFLDLDHFKPINDAYGHDIGDMLLLAVSERLSAAVRKSDTVARFGGDEFAILLPDLTDTAIAGSLARKLNESISRSFVIADLELNIGVSIGIAIYPNDGHTQNELTRKADEAMYRAKRQGGGKFYFSLRGH